MKKLVAVSVVLVMVGLISGCASTRETVAKEYNRVASLPPAEQIHSPNKSIDDVGRLSCDVYNSTHRLLKEYVAATTNHRQYTGFMNDVQAAIKDEGLSEEKALEKISALVQEEDKTRPDAEKVWPKIMEGWAAADALGPEKKLAEIATIVARNQDVIKSAKDLANAIQNEKDFVAKAQRGAEQGKIVAQTAQTGEMLLFLTEQFRRVQLMKNYRK